MIEPIDFEQIVEGTTSVFVPKQKNKEKGPGKKQGIPFYNPAMEFNRDLSIAVVQWLLHNTKKQHLTLLDGLAATGIRGIRFNHELTGSFQVIINDWSEEAFLVIKKNAEETASDRIRISNKNLNLVLLEEKFDYIDIDPFGSPALFIDSAMKSIQHNGVIALSATDSASLCGVYPKVCKRRYGATPLHGPVMHEIALRILLGFIAREAAKHELGIKPILSYKMDHYLRIYVKVLRNISSANETITFIKPLLSSDIFPYDKQKNKSIGPLWTGQLHSKDIVQKISKIVEKKNFGTKKMMQKKLSIFEEESEAPLFYFSTDDLGSIFHCSPPNMNDLWKLFKRENIPIFRTQFNPTGFKTPASFQRVKTLFITACEL